MCPNHRFDMVYEGKKNDLHLSIFTATLVILFGFSLSIPTASPITTWPKQPSPKGFPSTSLSGSKGEEETNKFERIVTDRQFSHSKVCYVMSVFDRCVPVIWVPVSGQLPAWILGQLVLRHPRQHRRAAGREAGGAHQHHPGVEGGARVH